MALKRSKGQKLRSIKGQSSLSFKNSQNRLNKIGPKRIGEVKKEGKKQRPWSVTWCLHVVCIETEGKRGNGNKWQLKEELKLIKELY